MSKDSIAAKTTCLTYTYQVAEGARRAPGDRGDVPRRSAPEELGLGEEEAGLTLRVLVGIRGVNRVPSLRLGVELPDRAGRSFGRVRRPDRVAQRADGARLLEHHGHARSRSHELHQFAVEGPPAVHGVELARLRLGQVHDARSPELEA